jgi:Ca-activated chloride channel family protein
VGLIGFRDRFEPGEEPMVLTVGGNVFTADTVGFSDQVAKLSATGGGDDPESSLDALVLAARQPFRPSAEEILVLITDAPPKVPDMEAKSLDEARQALRDGGIKQLQLVIQDADRSTYEDLRGPIPGQSFSLAETAEGRQQFELVLPKIAAEIAAVTKFNSPIQPDVEVSARQLPLLLLSIVIWSGVLSAGTCLALAIGQKHYLRRRLLTWRQAAGGMGGSFVAGAAAGALGLAGSSAVTLSGAQSQSSFIRSDMLVGWTVLGAVVGFGMSFFVPNLKRARALLAGGFGGALAAAGLMGVAAQSGEVAGRLMGAVLLGAMIGLMVALAEAALREAWIEVRFGRGEQRVVTLGVEPISLGSDQSCTVYARGAPPLALRYRISQGQVICEDVVAGRTTTASAGEKRTLGPITITVCGRTATPERAAAQLGQRGCHLRLSTGKTILLAQGMTLTADDLPGLRPHRTGGPVAQVVPHPSDPAVVGLKNLSNSAWTTTVGPIEKQITLEKSVTLVKGQKLFFGSLSAEIV